MWARWTELACVPWIVASPWLVGKGATEVVVVDLTVAALVALFAILSMRKPTHRWHLVTFAVATALFVYGWAHRAETAPVHENHVMIGLVLMMTTVVPTDALRPPEGWQRARAG